MGALVYDFPDIPEQISEGDAAEAARLVAAGPVDDPLVRGAAAVLARRAGICGIYEDLARAGLPVPAVAPEVVTRAELVAHLQAITGAIVQAELAADPAKIYRPDATHRCAADAPCGEAPADCGHAWAYSRHRWEDVPTIVGRDLETDAPIVETRKAEVPSRLYVTLGRVPHAPNVLTAADVAAARK